MWPVLFGFLHLALMFSNSFHIVVCFSTSFIFLQWVIVHWMHISILNFVYPFISWWTFGSLPTFGYCEQCCYEYSCPSVWVPVFNSFWYIPRNRVARSYENSVFNFLENLPLILFHSSLTILHSPPAMPEGCSFSTSLSTFVILHF